jgi:hypothetical protein
MPIIGTLPNNIQNGQAVDANPVMADFNFIVNQVNANGTPLGTLTAPSGTRTVFHQASAPTGWTIDTTITDHTIQMVAAGGAINAGAVGYSAMFLNQFSVDGHSLSIAELASHAHSDAGHFHSITDPQHQHGGINGAFLNGNGSQGQLTPGGATQFNQVSLTDARPTNITINTGNASITATGSGAAHVHTKTFNANYITCIVGVKT